MAGKEAIKFLRGTSTKRLASTATLSQGQPFYETDTNKLYIGRDDTLDTAVPIVATPDTHTHDELQGSQCRISVADNNSINFSYNPVSGGTDISGRDWYIHYGGTASFMDTSCNNLFVNTQVSTPKLKVNGTECKPLFRTKLYCYNSDQTEEDGLYDYVVFIDSPVKCTNEGNVQQYLLDFNYAAGGLLNCSAYRCATTVAFPIAVTTQNYSLQVHGADGTSITYSCNGQNSTPRWVLESSSTAL